jgi:parallel beta-helix repeat protein
MKKEKEKKKRKKLKIFLSVIFITFALIVSLPLTQESATIIVPGVYPTIQEAIYAANSGDTVYVQEGTYSLITNGETFPIIMRNGVSLVGEGADVCILDAGQIDRVIVCSGINNTLTKIEGFTITNGSGSLGGGGIYCFLSSPTITNNIIKGNSAPTGAGISCMWLSSPSIINNVITGNSASSKGGGIYCEFGSSPVITNNVIAGNEATGEWGTKEGGGIYCFLFSSPTITNNIITGNISSSGGGGIHCYSSSFPPITYNDVWGNTPLDYWDCDAGTTNISEDPLFVDPTISDYQLRAGSPCIDTGDNGASGLPEFDLDGNPRIVDGDDDGAAVVDMGAFEYQGVTAIEATIDIDPDTLNLKNKGNWVTAYIELPAGYNVADINVSTLWLNDSVKAELKPASIGDEDNDGIIDLMAKFDRPAVEDLLEVSENVEITVSGSLISGTQFVGIDIIRVISKGKK